MYWICVVVFIADYNTLMTRDTQRDVVAEFEKSAKAVWFDDGSRRG